MIPDGIEEKSLDKSLPAVNERVGTCGVSATILMNKNTHRIAFLFVNFSVGEIYISTLDTVSATSSLIVPANGGSIYLSIDSDFALPSRRWYVLASVASSQYLLIEQMLNDGARPKESV